MKWSGAMLCLLAFVLAGCASEGGGRYAQQHDAYPDAPPDVSRIPDAVPKVEPLAKSGNRPTYEVWGKTYHVLRDASGYQAVGKASWYGTKFQGYDTASGEPYDMYEMTAAHRTLPLPTYARVTNLDNGRDVIVRINDRGPFHGSRLIDLSYAAAARLKILEAGTGRVRVTAIDPRQWAAQHERSGSSHATSSTPPSNSQASAEASATSVAGISSHKAHYVQVGAFGSMANAQALKARLRARLSRPVRVIRKASWYRVQVGPIRDASHTDSIQAALQEAGFDRSFVVSAAE